jgi:hypothetical protein
MVATPVEAQSVQTLRTWPALLKNFKSLATIYQLHAISRVEREISPTVLATDRTKVRDKKLPLAPNTQLRLLVQLPIVPPRLATTADQQATWRRRHERLLMMLEHQRIERAPMPMVVAGSAKILIAYLQN